MVDGMSMEELERMTGVSLLAPYAKTMGAAAAPGS
jgi:hypothetical protein